jgi:hypothetical protein
VGVSLPLGQAVRRELLPLLRPAGDTEAELPGTVGGLPGADPVRYRPVVPEVVVEIEAEQIGPREFGRFWHRPRVLAKSMRWPATAAAMARWTPCDDRSDDRRPRAGRPHAP